MGKLYPNIDLLESSISIVDVPKGEYLNNSFLNKPELKYWALKSHTGMGGTHSALSDITPNIIITPNTSQVVGKEKSFNGLHVPLRIAFIYANSSTKWSDVLTWIHQGVKFHIYTTYANFKLLVNGTEKKKLQILSILKKSHRLVIDEAHSIISKKYMDVFSVLTKAITLFHRVILTTATPPSFIANQHLKGLPVYMFQYTNTKPIHINYNLGGNLDHLRKIIEYNVKHNIHTIVFTNEYKVHEEIWNITDNITGDTLKNKIQITKQQEDWKSFDYSKLVHVVSSTGFEGLDFIEDAHVIIWSKYYKSERNSHLGFTYNDIRQMIGRVRKKNIQVDLFVQSSREYEEYILEHLNKIPSSDELCSLTDNEIDANFSAKNNYDYDRLKGIAVILLVHKNITQLTITYKKLSKVKTVLVPKLSISEKIINIMGADNFEAIAINPQSFLQFNNKAKKDEYGNIKRSGYNSGLSIQDSMLYIASLLIYKFGLLYKIKHYDKHPSNRQQERLFYSIMKVITYIRYNLNFLKNITHIEIGFLDISQSQFNAFEEKFLKEMQNLIVPLINSDSNEHSEEYYNSNCNEKCRTFYEHKQNNGLSNSIIENLLFNFMYLYNIKYPDKTKIGEKLDSEIRKNTKDTSEVKLLKKQHKQYMIEVFLVLNGITSTTIEIGYREYNAITSIKSWLRIVLPIRLIEYDFISLNPTIVGNWLKWKGYPLLIDKVVNGTIYQIEGKTRSEAKKIVNIALNLDERHEDRVSKLRAIGIEDEGIQLIIEEFKSKGDMYRFCTQIEQRLIEELILKVNPKNKQYFRLHDAIFILGEVIDYSFDEMYVVLNGDKFYFKQKRH